MNTDLTGDEWCSITPSNRLVSFDNFKFCTTLDEFYSIVESALNHGYTSALSAAFNQSLPIIPREPFRREMIPEKMVEAVYKKMKELKHYPKTPAVQYFMKHYQEFYRTIGNKYATHEKEIRYEFIVHNLIKRWLSDLSKPYFLTGNEKVQNNKTIWQWNKPIQNVDTFF